MDSVPGGQTAEQILSEPGAPVVMSGSVDRTHVHFWPLAQPICVSTLQPGGGASEPPPGGPSGSLTGFFGLLHAAATRTTNAVISCFT